MGIVNAKLTTSELELAEVPEGKMYGITNILVCNVYDPDLPDADQHDAYFNMHLVPESASSATDESCVIKKLYLPAGETFTFDSEKVVLTEGDRVVFVAGPDQNSGTTDLSVTVSYLEV